MEDLRLIHLRSQVAGAILQARTEILWKPGKDWEHLKKRIGYGHLSPDTSLEGYNQIISTVLQAPCIVVYLFLRQETACLTVVSQYNGLLWLVIFSLSGIIETAFPSDNPDEYLADKDYVYIGTVKELLS